jgi:hypothetical protein
MNMPRKSPLTWSHQEVGVLGKLHQLHGDTPDGLHKTEKSFERHTPTDVRAKLVELGLMEKPQKPTLTEVETADVDATLERITAMVEPHRTLAIRYAIDSLKALLPKRAAKAPAAE